MTLGIEEKSSTGARRDSRPLAGLNTAYPGGAARSSSPRIGERDDVYLGQAEAQTTPPSSASHEARQRRPPQQEQLLVQPLWRRLGGAGPAGSAAALHYRSRW